MNIQKNYLNKPDYNFYRPSKRHKSRRITNVIKEQNS